MATIKQAANKTHNNTYNQPIKQASNQDLNQAPPLNKLIKTALTDYFVELDDAIIGNVYDLVIGEVEKPLLEFVMERAQNQNQAAAWLGLSRNTLRKLLYKHELLAPPTTTPR